MQKYVIYSVIYKEIFAHSFTDSEAVFPVLERTEVSDVRLDQQLRS